MQNYEKSTLALDRILLCKYLRKHNQSRDRHSVNLEDGERIYVMCLLNHFNNCPSLWKYYTHSIAKVTEACSVYYTSMNCEH